MRAEVWRQVWPEVRADGALSAGSPALHAQRLVQVYQALARRGDHLLAPLLDGRPPVQWAHYPDDDALYAQRRYQWYYHSHSLVDRPGAAEHGHFHLFARTDARRSVIDPAAEALFLKRLGAPDSAARTRHLLAIGMSSVGVPISLFTVNRWVTGDLLLSSANSLRLLEALSLDTGQPGIDRLIISLVGLCMPQVRALFRERDRRLYARARRGPGVLDDEALEVLSERAIDLDRRIASATRNQGRGVPPATTRRRPIRPTRADRCTRTDPR